MKKSDYQKALKKYDAIKILNLYRDNKIFLNEKEWKDLHSKINKKYLSEQDVEIFDKKFLMIGFFIIIFISITSLGGFIDQMTQCKKQQGHICTKYEVEKLEVEK